jgi:peptidoglycan/xylan/chitin deacetylase (PgdA/CDA1 family)
MERQDLIGGFEMRRKHLATCLVILLGLLLFTQAFAVLGSERIAADPPAFPGALVSVTFDDNYASQYSNALPALNSNGIKGTFYTVTGDIGNGQDYMTLGQLQEIKGNPIGHEIASHSVTHPSLTTVNDATLAAELANSKQTLETDGLGPIYDFAYPNGDYDDRVEAATKQYYISGREGFAKYGYETNNAANFNPTRIHIKRVLPTTTAGEITTWVNSAKNNAEWLVLMYHRVEVLQPPVVPDENDDYWYSVAPADFQAQMGAIHAVITQDPAKLASVTVKQAMDIVCPEVTASAPGGHGTVTPLTQRVKYGEPASIAITPDAGYEIISITDNGTGVGTYPYGSTYDIGSVTAKHAVEVTFGLIPSSLSVASIAPANASQFALYMGADITGSGFQPGASVKLEKGTSIIDAFGVNVISGTQINIAMVLWGVEPGVYDVVVTNPGGGQARLTGGFTVTSLCGQGSGSALLMLGMALGLLSLAGSYRVRRKRK